MSKEQNSSRKALVASSVFALVVGGAGVLKNFQQEQEQYSGILRRSSALPQQIGDKMIFTSQENVQLLPSPDEPKCKDTSSGTCGRTGEKIDPTMIVNHFTADGRVATAEDVRRFFAEGSLDRGRKRGVGVQFIVGTEGEILQLANMYPSMVEKTQGVQNYNNKAINIEVVNPGFTANGKDEIPQAQYDALLDLNLSLMKQYDIKLGPTHTWKAPSNAPVKVSGVVGHYQVNPDTKSDPGPNFMRDLNADIKKRLSTSSVAKKPDISQPLVKKGDPRSSYIALTLDTGQGEKGTGAKLTAEQHANIKKTLTILKENDAHVTFFGTGAFYADKANKDIINQLKTDGHEIANHTYDHPDAKKISSQAFKSEIERTEQAAKGAGMNLTKYFRYPFLSIDHTNILKQKGYKNIYMTSTCDSGDWVKNATAKTVYTHLTKKDCLEGGAIAIVHPYTAQSTGALGDILKRYKQAGKKAGRVSDVLG